MIQGPRFESAEPVWPALYRGEMNRHVGFQATITTGERASCEVRVAASSLYRFWVDGTYQGTGPARGPHGLFRVDSFSFNDWPAGEHHIAIEVCGYGVGTFGLPQHQPFLCAEVCCCGQVLAATGESAGFLAVPLAYRIQKVQRFSYMRAFSEVYDLKPGFSAWRTGRGTEPFAAVERIAVNGFLSRHIAPFQQDLVPFDDRPKRFSEVFGDVPGEHWKDRPEWMERAVTWVDDRLEGFPEPELEVHPKLEWQRWAPRRGLGTTSMPAALSESDSLVLKLPGVRTGMIGLELEVLSRTVLGLAFDEMPAAEGDVFCHRGETAQWVWLQLAPGHYEFETIEPYSLMFLKVLAVSGMVRVDRAWLRELANPECGGLTPELSGVGQELWNGAVQTYRQNALDTFMDCPSRERAGYCNDSFFAARGACLLSGGSTRVEDVFFENYLKAPDPVPGLPEKMLPMCYPGDFPEGLHIPNLPCWFVCQLEEYLTEREGNRDLVMALRSKVLGYLDLLETFRKPDTRLVEDLPGWIFIEWTAANQWTDGINIPANLLYSDALMSAARLYNLPDLHARAGEIRASIVERSFHKGWFYEQLVRSHDGAWVRQPHRSEICQYHAFRSGLASPETHRDLWAALLERGGPVPVGERVPAVEKPELIMGVFLRFDLLARYEEWDLLDRELTDVFLPMVRRSGTIHERLDRDNSLNHGLGSHVAVWLQLLAEREDVATQTNSPTPVNQL